MKIRPFGGRTSTGWAGLQESQSLVELTGKHEEEQKCVRAHIQNQVEQGSHAVSLQLQKRLSYMTTRQVEGNLIQILLVFLAPVFVLHLASVVVGPFALVVSDVALGTLDQQLAHRSVPDRFVSVVLIETLRREDDHVKGRVSILVLEVNVATPAIQVVDRYIVSRVTSPVHWSAAIVVTAVYADAFGAEVTQRPYCVTVLSGNVHHAEPAR